MLTSGSSTLINLIPLSQFNTSVINITGLAPTQLPDAFVNISKK
jgi:hypothetical protein